MHTGWRSPENTNVQFFCVILWHQSGTCHHLGRTFGVSNVIDFVGSGSFKNEIDDSRGIFCAHFFPGELPESFVFLVQSFMNLRKSVSSVVSHPNIISGSGENKRWSNRRSIEYPLHHISFKTML